MSTETTNKRGDSGGAPRIAVVGTGWWASQFHIPGLLAYEGADLVAIVDADPERLAAAHDFFDISAAFPSVDALLDSVELDGVVVATTSAMHYKVARQVLEAGIHTMVEKPMTVRAVEAWELVELARARGLHLQVGYTHHYTRSAERLHEVVSSGGIGEILHISGLYATMVEAYYRGKPEEYAEFYDFGLTGPSATTYSDPAVAGGGQGHTQVTHAIGMILWATGLRATEVSAFMEKTDLAVDLVDAIAYRLDNGGIGTLGSTGNMRPTEPLQEEVRYYGTEGYALQNLVSATIEIGHADGRVERITDAEAGDPYPARATACGFADLISGQGPNRAPGELGARAVEFLEAAYLSAERGERIRVTDLLEESETTR